MKKLLFIGCLIIGTLSHAGFDDLERGEQGTVVTRTFEGEDALLEGLPFIAITGEENDIADSADFEEYIQPRANAVCRSFGFEGAAEVAEEDVKYRSGKIRGWKVDIDSGVRTQVDEDIEIDALGTAFVIALGGFVFHSPAIFLELTCWEYN